MGFLYFFKNELNISWTFLSSKLHSPVIKTLERHSLNVKKGPSKVLITWESNFDEMFKKCSTDQNSEVHS